MTIYGYNACSCDHIWNPNPNLTWSQFEARPENLEDITKAWARARIRTRARARTRTRARARASARARATHTSDPNPNSNPNPELKSSIPGSTLKKMF